MSNGYLGSPAVLTSISNQEVVPLCPENWTRDRYLMLEFSFINYNPCKIRINNGETIYLDSEQGFESKIGKPKIESFVIVESGTKFSWLGVY